MAAEAGAETTCSAFADETRLYPIGVQAGARALMRSRQQQAGLFRGNAKVHKCETDLGDLRMVRVKAALPNRKRPFIERDGLGGPPLAFQQRRETDEGRGQLV